MRHQGGHFARTDPIAEASIKSMRDEAYMLLYHNVPRCRNKVIGHIYYYVTAIPEIHDQHMMSIELQGWRIVIDGRSGR